MSFFFFIITLQAYFLLHFQFLQWLKSRPLAALSACVYPLYSIINCFIVADYYFYNAPSTNDWEKLQYLALVEKYKHFFSLFKVVKNICVNVGLLRLRLHNITSQHWRCSVRMCSSFIKGRAMSVFFHFLFFFFYLCKSHKGSLCPKLILKGSLFYYYYIHWSFLMDLSNKAGFALFV